MSTDAALIKEMRLLCEQIARLRVELDELGAYEIIRIRREPSHSRPINSKMVWNPWAAGLAKDGEKK